MAIITHAKACSKHLQKKKPPLFALKKKIIVVNYNRNNGCGSLRVHVSKNHSISNLRGHSSKMDLFSKRRTENTHKEIHNKEFIV